MLSLAFLAALFGSKPMNEMLDKAEMAIRAHRHSTTEVQARECIRAIREPTEAMLAVVKYDSHGWGANNWRAMIDCILEGR